MSDENFYDSAVSSIEGDDAKTAATEILKGYESADKAFLDLVKVQSDIKSGRYADPRPASDAKPEEWATWREKNGIPKEAKGYSVGTDEQKKLFHSQNLADEQAKALFAEKSEDVLKAEADAAARKTDADRRAAWQFDYEANNALLDKITSDMPEDVRKAVDLSNIQVAQYFLDTLGDKHRTPTEPAKVAEDQKSLLEEIRNLEKLPERTDEQRKKLHELYEAAQDRGVIDERGNELI